MAIYAAADAVAEQTADMGDASFTTQAVYGNYSSLMIATRPAGYHSKPHRHDCEQLNWLQSGELWVFVEQQAIALHAGDFLRIPAGARHWSWNRSDRACVLVEVHSPGLHADPLIAAHATALFDPAETPEFLGSPVNQFLPDGEVDTASIEAGAR